jgi:hypothetical protein
VVAGSYTVGNLAPGRTATLRLEITALAGTPRGAVQSCLVTATSTASPSVADGVLARVTVS